MKSFWVRLVPSFRVKRRIRSHRAVRRGERGGPGFRPASQAAEPRKQLTSVPDGSSSGQYWPDRVPVLERGLELLGWVIVVALSWQLSIEYRADRMSLAPSCGRVGSLSNF